jgi:hypothetical protein
MKLRPSSQKQPGAIFKNLALLLALVLVAGFAWADNKPWKSKPYSAWDDKDIQVIMTESPWVQITTIRRTWLPVSEKNVPPEQQISGGARSMPQASPNVSGASPAAGTRESEASQQELNVYVYWDSSRVMRAAQARQRVLHGEMKDSEVDAYLHQPQDEYVVVLAMGDMTPFVKNDEKFFQANSSLQTKKGKLTLPPSHVVYQRDANGALQQAVFFFAKKTDSGAPTIGSDETDVSFKCKIADSTLRVGFNPQKMTDESGLDL